MNGRYVRLLGAPRVESDNRDLPRFRSQRTVALLGYLATEQRAIARDHLSALFWPDEPATTARANLRRELHNLSRILPDCWETDHQSVQFIPSNDTDIDLLNFLDLEEVGKWAEAAELVQGEFLEGVYLDDNLEFESWLLGQRERWRQQAETVLIQLIEQHSQQAHYHEALRYASRLLRLTPWNEAVHRQVMLMLAWTGQRAAALKQFEDCRRILAEELTVTPAEETLTLYTHIRETDFDGAFRRQLAAHYPHLTHPNNLPQPTSSFIGRSAEVRAVRAELGRPDVRLLTLTGPGGAGKTRLALQVAAAELSDFADGVFFVALAPINDAELVGATIAETLTLSRTASRPILDLLREYLQAKQILLVLDNFEHVLAAAPIVTELLTAARQLKIMVTSRSLLHLTGEWLYPVPPLALPEPSHPLSPDQVTDYEAVQLFGERAKAVKSNFAITTNNAEAVADICVKLDGLPLAIELTAARIRLLPPSEILTRLSNRLQFVTGGAQDLPSRQQTLRDTIQWSYDLLTQPEQILFQQVAVFAGGFTLDAVEAVSGAVDGLTVMDDLTSLIDKNLIRQNELRGESRFALLETIREFALEQLTASQDLAEIQRRHAQYFLNLAELGDLKIYTAEQVPWLNRLTVELDNLRTALAWSIENCLEIALRLVGALGQFWTVHNHHIEGRDWLDKALKKKEFGAIELRSSRAKALWAGGLLAHFQGDHLTAGSFLTESVDIWQELEDSQGLTMALCYLGVTRLYQAKTAEGMSLLNKSINLSRRNMHTKSLVLALFWHGWGSYRLQDYASALSQLEMCIKLAEDSGEVGPMAAAISVLGRMAFQQSRFQAASVYFEQSLFVFQEHRQYQGIAIVRELQGELAYVQCDYETAQMACEMSLEMSRTSGNSLGVAKRLLLLGQITLHLNVMGQASDYFKESIGLFLKLNQYRGLAHCLVGLAGVTVATNQPVKAARLYGAAEALLERAENRSEVGFGDEFAPVKAMARAAYERNVATLRQALGHDAFSAAWNNGRNLSLEEVLTYVMEK
ncbi:MAG: BTAD domain-containing putative transcriptional regulator [Caldilineaceae bacterium]